MSRFNNFLNIAVKRGFFVYLYIIVAFIYVWQSYLAHTCCQTQFTLFCRKFTFVTSYALSRVKLFLLKPCWRKKMPFFHAFLLSPFMDIVASPHSLMSLSRCLSAWVLYSTTKVSLMNYLFVAQHDKNTKFVGCFNITTTKQKNMHHTCWLDVWLKTMTRVPRYSSCLYKLMKYKVQTI